MRISSPLFSADKENDIWVPDDSYVFPSSGKRNLKFQRCWLKRWNWLAYSEKDDGAYCKYCVLFAGEGGDVGKQTFGNLVKKPFKNWKDAIEVFNNHRNCEYHKTSILKETCAKQILEKKVEPIDIQIDSGIKRKIIENRKNLIPIIETIIFCGRLNLSLRGHRDSGLFNLTEPYENDGNFRSLLRFRAKSGDVALKTHLETCSKNASYISPIASEIISTCGDIILKKIVNKINEAKCFSILVDETSDISGIEQFSLCARYFNNGQINEDFLLFVPVTDVTGKGLASTLLTSLDLIGIDYNYMIDQGYDGAAAMSGSVESIYNFFNSPKRQNILTTSIQNIVPISSHTKLKQLCPTRWVQRHDSVIIYLELQDAVIDALEKISSWPDKNTSSSANQLHFVINNFEFQITIQIISTVFAVSLPLSKLLQTPGFDLSHVINMADNSINVLKEMRKNVEKDFKLIFERAEIFCKNSNINISLPRRVGKQVHRDNTPVTTLEEYYKVTIFIPYLDTFITMISDRLLKHKSLLKSFNCLFPIKEKDNSDTFENDITGLVKKYSQLLPSFSPLLVIAELKLWWTSLQNLSKIPSNLSELLNNCNENDYPNVYKLLKIVATLPITTATAERSFSTIRRLKTYLRNTMAENRLNGLAQLNIHRTIEVIQK
ncbi:hypothetical protein QTP88_001230 [Uroleucon formosanum]